MSRRYLLDTNTVSYIIKGRSPAARAKLAGLQSHHIACISSITEAELRFGLVKSEAKSAAANSLRSPLEAFFTKIKIYAWGREEALAYGGLRHRQEATTGKPLGSLDMLIAAHAIALGAILVTRDEGFSNVPELSDAVNWATDLE